VSVLTVEHLFVSEGSFILWDNFPDKQEQKMSSPETQPASLDAIGCTEIGCERPVVHSTRFCRIHLAEAFLRDGESLAFFDKPDLAGIEAAAMQIVRTALEGLPDELLGPNGTRQAMDMYALLGPKEDWARAQVGLNFLQAVLADEPPIGGARLEPPMEWMGGMLLRLQVGVPTPAVDELQARLRLVMEAMIREMVGPSVPVAVAVGPAEES
jgi:hypothetical protein